MKRSSLKWLMTGAAAVCLLAAPTMASEGCCSKDKTKAAGAAAPAGCGGSHAAGEACGHSAPAKPAPKHSARPGRAVPKELQPVFTGYINLQTELAGDSTKDLAKSATSMAEGMRNSGSGCLSGAANMADAVGKAKDIKAAREEFSKLSSLMAEYVSIANIAGYSGFYCDMAKAGWLQQGTEMKNPYMGAKMLRCGQQVF